MATDARAELNWLIATARGELRTLERARKQLGDDPVRRRRRSTQDSKR